MNGEEWPSGEAVVAALERQILWRRELGDEWVERLGRDLWSIIATDVTIGDLAAVTGDSAASVFTDEVDRVQALLLHAIRVQARGRPREDKTLALVSCLSDASRALNRPVPEGVGYGSSEEYAVAAFVIFGAIHFRPIEGVPADDIIEVLRVYGRAGGRPQKGDSIGDKWQWIARWCREHLGVSVAPEALKKSVQRLKKVEAAQARTLQRLKGEGSKFKLRGAE